MAYIETDPRTGKQRAVSEGRGSVEKAEFDRLAAEAQRHNIRLREEQLKKGIYPHGSLGAWRRRR